VQGTINERRRIFENLFITSDFILRFLIYQRYARKKRPFVHRIRTIIASEDGTVACCRRERSDSTGCGQLIRVTARTQSVSQLVSSSSSGGGGGGGIVGVATETDGQSYN